MTDPIWSSDEQAWKDAHAFSMDDHSLRRDELLSFLRSKGLIGTEEEVKPELDDDWFEQADACVGETRVREGVHPQKEDIADKIRQSLSMALSSNSNQSREWIEDQISRATESVLNVVKDYKEFESLNEEEKGLSFYRNVAKIHLDEYFGLSKDDVHEAIRKDALLNTVYRCAVEALAACYVKLDTKSRPD